MSKRFLAGVLMSATLVLFTSTAFAFNDQTNNNNQSQVGINDQDQLQLQGQQQGIFDSGNSSNTNRNTNTNLNSQGQDQDQYQGQKQGQANIGLGSGNKTSVELNQTSRVDAEPSYAPDVSLTSSGCIGSAGVSGGGGGVFSFGVATTTSSEECFKIEIAKILIASGKTDEAMKLLLSIDYVGEVLNPEEPMKTAMNDPASSNQQTKVDGPLAARDHVWNGIPITYDW
jgi:hypothetical protein